MTCSRPSPQEPTTSDLRCKEVWSGNGSIHNAISVPGIDAWISSDPFRQEARGGDIYHIATCGSGRISRFAVVDLAGHGAVVGEPGRCLHALLREHADSLDLTQFAGALNRGLLAHAGHRFATALLAAYHAASDRLIICNAGHPRPLWYRAATRSWHVVLPGGPMSGGRFHNLPLGITAATQYTQCAFPLEPGDLVLIYTDSLVESAGRAGRFLGEQGLLDLLRRMSMASPESLNARLREAVAEYRRGDAQDDETLLVLHHNAADPPLDEALEAAAEIAA